MAKRLNRFSMQDHLAGTIPLCQYSAYHGLPWYEEEFSGSGEIRCECCNQLTTAYSRKFDSISAKALQTLYAFDRSCSPNSWMHYTDFSPNAIPIGVSLLASWALIESQGGGEGMWRISKAGEMFVTLQAGIPKRVVRRLQEDIAFCGPLVMLFDCTDMKFKYSDAAGT